MESMFMSAVILVSITTLTLIIGGCITSMKSILSIRVEKPMNIVVLFMLIGLPLLHIEISNVVATLIVVIMTLLLNTWVVYTMYLEQLSNEQKEVNEASL